MNGIKIDFAKKEDIAGLRVFYFEQLGEEKEKGNISKGEFLDYKTWYSREALRNKILSKTERKKRIFLLAKDTNGKILGVIDGRSNNVNNLIINWILVSYEFRNQKIGTNLLQNIIEESVKQKVAEIISFCSTQNEISIKLHKSAEFENIGETLPDFYGEGTSSAYKWKKVI